MKRVLFVCLGNICRSPAAEAVFKNMVEARGLNDMIEIDSCGTSGYHSGEPADPRMMEHAKKRNYDLTSIARGFDAKSDFQRFDLILTMDNSNYNNVLKLNPSGEHHHKVRKFVSFCTENMPIEVPDPYFGGTEGFDLVLDILEDGCRQLLAELEE